MENRPSTDELREKIHHFKKGAEALYRYGNPGYSKTLFDRLSSNDQKRLIYWALIDGDTDIKNVAEYFMQQLNPAPNNLKELFEQMNQNDRNEIEIEMMPPPVEDYPEDTELLETDKQKIMDILSEACSEIGSLEFEEAYWVLIPSESSKSAVWLSARGRAGHISSVFAWPDHVCYDPEKEEQQKLLNMMLEASLVLHIHNHPTTPNTVYGASPADRSFAKHWKYLCKELTAKMKFFITQEKSVFEYKVKGDDIQWVGNKIEHKPLSKEESEREYYKKEFPLEVLKRIRKEKIKKFCDKLFEDE